jgi:quercetin dioxygenase-like cupin family protein
MDNKIESHKLDDMVKGWFIGNFTPTLFETDQVEVAIKKYKAGDFEDRHYHKIATEFTAVIGGKVEMDGKEYIDGDIVKINAGVATSFRAITDVTTVVVKVPCVKNDKYLS